MNILAHLMFMVAKFFTKKDYINQAVAIFGKTCYVTHSISSKDLDLMMKELSLHIGGRFDYSFCGGRAAIKHLGSSKSLTERQDYLKFIHDKYFIKQMEERNQTTSVTGIDGQPKPFYSYKNMQDTMKGIWEYNQMYRA